MGVGLVGRIVTAALVIVLAGTPAALADSAPIGSDAAAPGSDPNHATPIELLASQIASHIAGRSVTVRCWDAGGWTTLATAHGFDPGHELGFVASQPYWLLTGTFVSSATTAELSPAACSALQQFAQATTKPTKCQVTTSNYVDVTRTRTVTRWRVVRVKGKVKKIPYQAQVTYTETVLQSGLGPPTPCFLGEPSSAGANRVCAGWPPNPCFSAATNEPSTYWQSYDQLVEGIATLAHEPIHLWQIQSGYRVPSDSLVESQATCAGMQWIPYVAEQLGDTADDAQAIADFYWLIDYPGMKNATTSYEQTHPYWSADCVPGGALDIRAAGSTVWP